MLGRHAAERLKRGYGQKHPEFHKKQKGGIKKMKKKFWISVIILLIFVQFNFPLEKTKKVSKIVIDHLENSIIYQNRKGRTEVSDLESNQEFTIRKNEEVAIWVNPNPLLYNYTWKGETRTKTDNFKAASEFAKALEAILALMGTPDPISDLSGILKGTVISDKKNKIANILDETLKNSYISQNIKGVSVKIFLEHLGDRIRSIKNNFEEMEELIKDTRTKKGVEKVKSKVEAWNVLTLKKEMVSDFEEMNKVLSEFSEKAWCDNKSNGSPVNKLEWNQLRAIILIHSYLIQESNIQKMLDTLISFDKTVRSINQPIYLGTIYYSSSEKITATISITNKHDNRNSNIKEGDFSFIFEPYNRLKLELKPAFVYSFVRKVEYTTEETIGGFKIIKKDNDKEYHGLNVAAMLLVTPKFLDNISVYSEIGVSPIKDKIGLYAGLGIKFQKVFSFGGGLTLQQIEKLDGLKEGDILENQDDLKINRPLKPGLYLHFTVNIN